MYATELATLAAELSASAVGRLADLDRCTIRGATCPTCARVAELLQASILCVRYNEPATAERLVNDAIATLDDPAHAHRPITHSDDRPGSCHPDSPVGDRQLDIPTHD